MSPEDPSRVLLDAAPDPIIVTDEDDRIVLVNAQAERVFGYPREELLGRSIDLILPERPRASDGPPKEAPQSGRASLPARYRQVPARSKDGRQFPAEISLSRVEAQDRRLMIAILRDVSERVELEEKLRYLSTHDALTGLYNRAFFEEERARLERGRHYPVSVLVLDVDGLKTINDTEGHDTGDELLRRTATVIRDAFRGDDVAARIGGDEFAILLPFHGPEAVQATVGRLEEAAEDANSRWGLPYVAFSIGGATAMTPGTLAEALRNADQAMRALKKSKRGGTRDLPSVF